MSTPLIDAEAAAGLLGVPASCIRKEARADRIPNIKLGHYRRFDPDRLMAWARQRARGPIYPDRSTNGGPGDVGAPRGLTPNP